jgi:hypothetical protein
VIRKTGHEYLDAATYLMPSDDNSKKQVRSLLYSAVFISLSTGLLLAIGFGLILHLGFGVSYDRMFQLIFHAFRR